MKRFTFLLALLALALVFGLTLASCGGDGDPGSPGTPDTPSSGNEGSLYAKAPPVSASDTPVNLSGTWGDTVVDRAVYYINANPGTYTLLLNSDIEVGAYMDTITPEFNRRLYQPNVNLTIIGNGAERKIKNTSSEILFIVGNYATEAAGIKLTLGSNITLMGRVSVAGGAELIMKDNAAITSSIRYSSYGIPTGSGVTLSGKAGTTFTMQDNSSVYGHVSLNGGGVFVGEYCTFNMQDNASVYGNSNGGYIGFGGGVYVAGTFNMRGGTISGNSASMGGGVYVDGGTFIMSGGTVYGNDVDDPLRNTGSGAALALSSSASKTEIARYGDGSNILPHTDGERYRTSGTIAGR